MFSDSEDFATKRACLGALATVASVDSEIRSLIRQEVDPTLIIDAVQDSNVEICHRGGFCFYVLYPI